MRERRQRIMSLVDYIRTWHGKARVITEDLQRFVTTGTSYVYAEKSSEFEKANRYANMLDQQQAVAIEATLNRTADLYVFLKEEDMAWKQFPVEGEKFDGSLE